MAGDWLLDQLDAPEPPSAPPPPPAVSRGVRNNNYLNVTAPPDGSWPGQVGTDGDFATFDKPESGMAAADQNLAAYGTKHGIKTVADAINRWTGNTAPPDYINGVATALGVKPDDTVDLSDPAFRQKMLTAMTPHESGRVASMPDANGWTPEDKAMWDDLHGGDSPTSPPTHVTWDAAAHTYRDAQGNPYTFPTSEGHLTSTSGGEYRIVPPEEASSVKNNFSNLGQGAIEAPIRDPGLLSIPDAALRGVANGITGGWADKLGALSDSVFGNVNYSKALTREQAQTAQDRAQFPVTSAISGLAGNVGQALALPELKAAGLGGRALQGMAQGGALGFVNGTGQARGDIGAEIKAGALPAAEGALTGMAFNSALGPTVRGPNALAAYDQVGMKPTLAMLGGPSTQRVAGALRGVPLIATPLNDVAANEASGLSTGLLDTAQRYGQSTNANQAGTALQEGAAAARDKLQAGVNDAYRGVNRYEASPTLVPATNTQQTIATAFSKYPNLQEWFQSHSPVLAGLNTALTKAGGQLTFGELKALRTDVGGLMSGHIGNDVNTVDQASLKNIYGALTKDMEGGIHGVAYQDAIAQGANPAQAGAAGSKAQADLATANAANAKMRDTMESTLLPIMDAKGPEAAYQKLVGAAQGGAGKSDMNALLRAKAALPPDAWNEVAAGTIATMGRKNGDAAGEFNTANFLTQIGKMSPSGRAALFGNSTPDLNAFEEIARNQIRSNKFLNHSNSANVMGVRMEAGGIVLAGQQALAGNYAPAMVLALTGSGSLVASHLLASPGFARLMVGVSKVASPGAIDTAFEKFAVSNPRIAPELAIFRNKLSTIATANATTAEGNSLVPVQSRQKAP